jgi:acyl-CoA reductase-like NAD-dependent aldehyde dehydrogenase
LTMSKTFQVISPIDGSMYCQRDFASSEQIEGVLDSAYQARGNWRNTSVEDRAVLCRKAIKYLADHADDIGEEITRQMGRPIKYSALEVTGGLQERANYMIDIAALALADIRIPDKQCFKRYIRREALGTVFVLAPWNYPFLTAVNAIIPALMAGNTVILKHAKQTPLCAERFSEAFQAAGLPEGVFQYLHLEHEQVALLIGDRRIDYVAFTGSVGGGAAVQLAMNQRFINAGLELGGKDPAYVRADANLANAVENLVDGAFFNSGQSCCGIERIYVHHSLYQEFVKGFVALTKQYILGDPLKQETTMGPMVRIEAAAYVRNEIAKAVDQGAKPWIDASIFPKDKNGSAYLAPQILTDVTHDMSIMSEESFGPVVGIMSVDSDAEAISLMNDSQYGLTASIWTQDKDSISDLGNRLETGTVFMNRCDYLDPALAWTGVKNSGRGCTLSSLGYEVLTRPKSFHLKEIV